MADQKAKSTKGNENSYMELIEEQLEEIKIEIDKTSNEIKILSERKAAIEGSINQTVTNLVLLQGKQTGLQEYMEKIKDAEKS